MAFKVLLVEDRYEDVLLTIEALKEFSLDNHIDIDIETMMDGAEALDYLFCRGNYASRLFHIPDLVLLDLHIPKIDGYELLDKIKSTPSTKSIPVVVMTTLNSQKIYDACIELKADDFITKSMNDDDFHHAIIELGKNWILPRLH